jgi:septal ring-binding cell division protein DamX
VPAPAKPEPPAPAPAPPKPEPPKPVAALPKPEPAKPPPKASDKPVDKATQPDSTSWVESLDPNAWVMQHGAFDSLSEARTFQSSALGYKAGQVLFTQRKGSKPYYILITGPYAEKAQAEALMKQNPPLAKAWLRSVKSLKAQFQE